MAGTEYFDLTPRKQSLILDSSCDLSSPGDVTRPDRACPPFNVETSSRGRTAGRKAPGSPRQRGIGKENLGPASGTLQGAGGDLARAALKREQVVQELSQAQANERSRRCIFKGAGNTAEVDSKASTSQTAQKKELTVPQGPSLNTAIRSSSRSLSANRHCESSVRSHSTPLRSVGDPELSRRSRGTSRGHAMERTPEMSVRSMRSVRSTRSVISSASLFSASLVGRYHCTRALTFPQGPKLATETRSRSHSVGTRTPTQGTPEKRMRSLSVNSARSTSRTPLKLTVPNGPLLSTELRSRSRSVGMRTPSVDSVSSVHSVRSARPMTIPKGPVLATALRGRSHSVGTRTPSACTPERSVRSSLTVTVPHGPNLATEVRSRSRLRTPSAHSVGTPEGSVHSFRSCRSCSVRGTSVRSRSMNQPALTIPVGPLLETQLRSWSRSRDRCAANNTAKQLPVHALKPSESSEASDHAKASGTSREADAEVNVKMKAESDTAASRLKVEPAADEFREKTDQEGTSASDGILDASESMPEPQPGHKSMEIEANQGSDLIAADESSGDQQERVEATEGKDTVPPMSDAQVGAATPNLLDYLPDTVADTPQRSLGMTKLPEIGASSSHLQKSDKTPQRSTCEAGTPECRAESRKQQVLAKVAEDHAEKKKQHFVFGRSGATPMRTPLRKKADTQNRAQPEPRKLDVGGTETSSEA